MPVIYLWPFINVWYDHSKAGFYGVMYKWTCLDFSVIKNYNIEQNHTKISLWMVLTSALVRERAFFFFNWQSNFFHNIRYYNIPASILYYHLLSIQIKSNFFSPCLNKYKLTHLFLSILWLSVSKKIPAPYYSLHKNRTPILPHPWGTFHGPWVAFLRTQRLEQINTSINNALSKNIGSYFKVKIITSTITWVSFKVE